MLRVSTTWLESFRRMLETEWQPEGELIDTVKRKPIKMRWQAEAGSAWHRLIEVTVRREVAVWASDGRSWCELGKVAVPDGWYTFDAEAIFQAKEAIGPGLWEFKRVAMLDGVELVAKADHVLGLDVTDNKTKFSSWSVQDYEDSLQWRAYLWVHGARSFRYRVWRMSDPKERHCQLLGHDAFTFWPYHGLEADLRSWLGRFLEWCEKWKLMGYLSDTRKAS